MSYKKNRAERVSTHVKASADGADITTGVATQVSKDGGAFANTTNAVAHVANGVWTVALTATEMNANHVTVKFATALALTATVNIRPSIKVVDDALDANDRVDLGLWVGVAPDALSSGKVAADLKLWLASAPDALSTGKVAGDVKLWLASAPNVLVSGDVPAHTKVISTSARDDQSKGVWDFLQTAILLAGSIGLRLKEFLATLGTDDKVTVSSDAHTSGQTVKAVTDPVTAGTVTDKVGYSLSTAGILDIWHQLLTAIVTAGSIGLKLKDWALGTDDRALVSADVHTSGQTVANITSKTGYSLADPQAFDNTGQTTNLPGNLKAVDASTLAVARMKRALETEALFTVNTTTFPPVNDTAPLDPLDHTTEFEVDWDDDPGTLGANGLKGRVILFDRITATVALRRQGARIVANIAGTGGDIRIKVNLLTTLPTSGDIMVMI